MGVTMATPQTLLSIRDVMAVQSMMRLGGGLRRRGAGALLGGGDKDGLNKSPSPSAPADGVQVQVVGVAIGGNYLCRGPGEMIDVCLGRTLCPSHPPSGFICAFKITWQQRGVGAFWSRRVSPERQPDEFTVENNVFFIHILY